MRAPSGRLVALVILEGEIRCRDRYFVSDTCERPHLATEIQVLGDTGWQTVLADIPHEYEGLLMLFGDVWVGSRDQLARLEPSLFEL